MFFWYQAQFTFKLLLYNTFTDIFRSTSDISPTEDRLIDFESNRECIAYESESEVEDFAVDKSAWKRHRLKGRSSRLVWFFVFTGEEIICQITFDYFAEGLSIIVIG